MITLIRGDVMINGTFQTELILEKRRKVVQITFRWRMFIDNNCRDISM